jgi:Protein of unknown function (DUF2500)
MSELDNFDTLFALFLVVFVLLFLFMIGNFVKLFLKRRAIKLQNDLSPILTKKAEIVSKRSETWGGSGDSSVKTSYFATFEFSDNKDRLEFIIPFKEYGLMVENDLGELTFQGTRFHKFQRTLQ